MRRVPPIEFGACRGQSLGVKSTVMHKLTVACMAVMAAMGGCTGERANSSPPESPPGVDFQYNAPEEGDSAKSDAKSDEAESSKTESSKTESAKSKPTRESSREPSTSPEGCKGLAQKKCEVSVGCAWSTDKKCVPQ